jgi:hypothetical protein
MRKNLLIGRNTKELSKVYAKCSVKESLYEYYRYSEALCVVSTLIRRKYLCLKASKKHRGIDSLIFCRRGEQIVALPGWHSLCFSYPKVRKRDLTKALYRSEKSGRAPWTFIVSLRETIKK